LKRTRRRRWARLALFNLVVAVVLLELGLRVAGGELFPPRFFEAHAQFGHFHVPGRTGWQRTDEYSSYITINGRGLRDHERPYAKPEGVFRILVLGDSFVEGLQVGQDETFPARLEEALNQDNSAPLDVINAGVSRYGTSNALLFLEGEGLRYQPDLVIYAFYPNDVTDNIENGLFELAGNQLIARPATVSPVEHVRGVLYDLSYIYRFALGLSLHLGQATDETLIDTGWGKVLPIYRAHLLPREERAWQVTGLLLERMHAATTRAGARLVVVCLPEHFQSEDRLWAQVAQSAEVLERDAPNRALAEAVPEGTAYLDLLPGFQAAAQSQALYYAQDHHFNAAGHALAADLIATYLAGQGLLPES
jgi:lysophospholipase L1-like esterase